MTFETKLDFLIRAGLLPETEKSPNQETGLVNKGTIEGSERYQIGPK